MLPLWNAVVWWYECSLEHQSGFLYLLQKDFCRLAEVLNCVCPVWGRKWIHRLWSACSIKNNIAFKGLGKFIWVVLNSSCFWKSCSPLNQFFQDLVCIKYLHFGMFVVIWLMINWLKSDRCDQVRVRQKTNWQWNLLRKHLSCGMFCKVVLLNVFWKCFVLEQFQMSCPSCLAGFEAADSSPTTKRIKSALPVVDFSIVQFDSWSLRWSHD